MTNNTFELPLLQTARTIFKVPFRETICHIFFVKPQGYSNLTQAHSRTTEQEGNLKSIEKGRKEEFQEEEIAFS